MAVYPGSPGSAAEGQQCPKRASRLEGQLADVTNTHDSAPQHGRKKKKMVDSGSEEDTKEIKKLGHKFVMMKMIWLPDLSGTIHTKLDDQYNHLERFENHASKVQGELVDLLDLLAQKFHGEIMQSKWLIKTFHKAMQNQRSNTHTRLRSQCRPEIFDCMAINLFSIESRRDKFCQMIGYVERDNRSARYDRFNVPSLHKNYNGSFNIETVFCGPMLHLASLFGGHKCALLTTKAVTAIKKTGKPNQATGQTVSHLWALDHCTPGSIGSWAVSADTTLTVQGVQMGINWHADLEKCIQYLQNGLDRHKASVLKLFREWDKLFFPNSETSLACNNDDKDHEDQTMKDVMDMLDADEEEAPAEPQTDE
ncbi:hypothetical protein B0H17DRAFT_943567 [Mycena rosella]|uniref:Uncharacterized protein n=1 Tax=Mycena rosella TaxID=1033263 RepID=A0AAD7GD61_MYCRO|nr:hypothetical protein B0H17DRAFT_943567 [Mycena rosella]